MYLEPDHIFYPFYTLLISKSRIVNDLGVGFCLFSLISEPYQCITYWSLRHPIPCIAQPIPQFLGGVAILSSWKPLIAASHRSSPWKAKWTEDTKQGYITKAWLLLRQKYMNLFPGPIHCHPFCHRVFHTHFLLSAWLHTNRPWCQSVPLESDRK